MYDFIIIGGGAAGLFASIFAPKDVKKIILEKNKSPGDSKELLNFLTKKSKENKTEIKTNFEVIYIEKKDDLFYIKSYSGEEVVGKKVLISAGGKSFFKSELLEILLYLLKNFD